MATDHARYCVLRPEDDGTLAEKERGADEAATVARRALDDQRRRGQHPKRALASPHELATALADLGHQQHVFPRILILQDTERGAIENLVESERACRFKHLGGVSAFSLAENEAVKEALETRFAPAVEVDAPEHDSVRVDEVERFLTLFRAGGTKLVNLSDDERGNRGH
ncbi:MAG: hypothetical protein AAF928_07520, partial [Myxococcota bacterium]